MIKHKTVAESNEFIAKLIDAGFVAESDCNGDEFYIYRVSQGMIVVRRSTHVRVAEMHLVTARKFNI